MLPHRSSLAHVVLLCGVCVLAVVMALAVGSDGHFGFGGNSSPEHSVLFSLRGSRVWLGAVVGAALAVSGSALQALTRNPLADPFILGVSGGAGLGATIVLALGGDAVASPSFVSWVSAGALVGAALATVAVLSIGAMFPQGGMWATLLAGVIFNAFALGTMTFVKVLAAPEKLGSILFWLAGTISYEPSESLTALTVVEVVVLGLLWAWSNRLNVLSLGEDDAETLGIHVRRTRLWLLVLTSVAVAAAVAVVGLVGFVGLLVPHAARVLVGADQRRLIPASAVLGAAFLVTADAMSRATFAVFAAEPPVGAVTALLGGPAFLGLMVRLGRKRAVLG